MPIISILGALVYERTRVSRIVGEVSVIMKSDLNIASDRKMLETFAKTYDEQCSRNGGIVFKICYSNNMEVQEKIKETMNFLDQKYGKHKPHMVPDAAITDLRKLLRFNTTINDQELLVASIKVPIISDSKYEMHEVMNVSLKISQLILTSQTTT